MNNMSEFKRITRTITIQLKGVFDVLEKNISPERAQRNAEKIKSRLTEDKGIRDVFEEITATGFDVVEDVTEEDAAIIRNLIDWEAFLTKLKVECGKIVWSGQWKESGKMGYIPCEQCEHHYKDENGTEHCKVVDEHKSLNENCPECKREREQARLEREEE